VIFVFSCFFLLLRRQLGTSIDSTRQPEWIQIYGVLTLRRHLWYIWKCVRLHAWHYLLGLLQIHSNR
jgi:hypothetical protein